MDKLSKSEERFRSIFIFAKVGIALMGRNGNILECNTTFQDMLEYRAGELIGVNFSKFTFQGDLPREEYLLADLAAGRIDSYNQEKRVLTKRGAILWVDAKISAIYDNHGEPAYFVSTLADITERRNTEQKLRVLSRAVEASPVSIVITNIDGEIEYTNPFFSELTGFSTEDILGHNPRILKSGQTKPEVYAQMWCKILGGEIWEGEFINKKKNGELYHELALIAPVLDQSGKITHFVAIKDDITERKKAEEALLKQNQTQQALLEITLDIATASGSRTLLRRIMQNAEALLEADQGGSIILYDSQLGQLKIVEGSGVNRNIVGQTFPANHGISGQVFQTGRSIIIQDYANWEGRLTLSGAEVPGAAIGIPLRVERQVIGVLTLFADTKKRIFTPEDVQLAEMFAAQAAVAYQNIRLYERTQMELAERRLAEEREREQRNFAEALQNITAILNTSLDLDHVLDQILLTVERVVPYDAINIMFIEDGIANTVRSRSKKDSPTQFLPNWNEPIDEYFIFKQLIETHQTLILADTRNYPDWSIPEIQWVQSYIGVPILVDGRVTGIVNLGSQMPGFYNEEYARRLQIFASQAALAIKNAGLYARVQYLAVNDPLLKIYNRRGLVELGRREIERVKRFNRPLSALFLDIDHFKNINDTYQHQVGDQVLSSVSSLMRTYIREVDIISRYGGEEFVILLPEIDLASAEIVAERLRKGIENMRIQTTHGSLSVTISIGVSALRLPSTHDSDDINLLNGLLERASAMLHVAKANGRNRVEVEKPTDQIPTNH
jgi:diguanylate cyclase (GGDEF)-like protein/PAS domain S-box-containing protein